MAPLSPLQQQRVNPISVLDALTVFVVGFFQEFSRPGGSGAVAGPLSLILLILLDLFSSEAA
jgi:hypothetical protein